MTILALLLALVIAHFARGFRHIRRYHWPLWLLRQVQVPVLARLPQHGWLAPVITILLVVLAAALLTWPLAWLAGELGLFLLAVAVLLYTLGPRDLDSDVAAVLTAPDENAANLALISLGQPGDSPAQRLIRSALGRWFGVIFWFVLLGIVGALLYRLTDEAVRQSATGTVTDPNDATDPGAIDPASVAGTGSADGDAANARLLQILQWPVAQLMTLALAVSADFDRVWTAWRQWHAEHGWRPLGCGMLLAATEAVAGDVDIRLSVARAMQLAWRMLIAWLVVLSLMLLAGWLT